MGRKKPAAIVALQAVRPQCQADPNCEEPGIGSKGQCQTHAMEQHLAESKAYCKERGLHTVDQMREFCKKKMGFKRFSDARGPASNDEEKRETARKVANGEIVVSTRNREPGDDDDEVSA